LGSVGGRKKRVGGGGVSTEKFTSRIRKKRLQQKSGLTDDRRIKKCRSPDVDGWAHKKEDWSGGRSRLKSGMTAWTRSKKKGKDIDPEKWAKTEKEKNRTSKESGKTERTVQKGRGH